MREHDIDLRPYFPGSRANREISHAAMEANEIRVDRALAEAGAYELISPDSQILYGHHAVMYRLLGMGTTTKYPEGLRSRFKTELQNRDLSSYYNLKAPELEEKLTDVAQAFVQDEYQTPVSVSPQHMWNFLRLPFSDEVKKELFESSGEELQVEKNFPLGTTYGEVAVSGLKERLDPIEATRLLVGGLIGRKRESIEAAQRVFDKEKLERGRKWIKGSDVKSETLFRKIAPLLAQGDISATREVLSFFEDLSDHDVSDLVSGVLGLFGEDEPFSRLVIKMQNGVFADMFDNTRLMSCTFLSGMYAGAAFRYRYDPDIGLLHVVPGTVDGLGNPIGVSIMVNASDELGNKWLVVDSVEGGMDLERVRESLWIPAVYDGILAVGRDIAAEYILFNDRTYNGRPKRFLEYVAKRHEHGEPELTKMGIQEFSYPGIPESHISEAIETWKGQTSGQTSGLVAATEI